jgi:hypothetical protein
MLALIPWTFGNRRPDVFGNVHVAYDYRGMTKIHNPGIYTGRHRATEVPWPLRVLARWKGT